MFCSFCFWCHPVERPSRPQDYINIYLHFLPVTFAVSLFTCKLLICLKYLGRRYEKVEYNYYTS